MFSNLFEYSDTCFLDGFTFCKRSLISLFFVMDLITKIRINIAKMTIIGGTIQIIKLTPELGGARSTLGPYLSTK